MPTFHHDGIDFNYETNGEGFPLVLCHGLGGDLSQPKSTVGTVEGFRTILMDCRGHGGTEPVGPEEAFSFPQFSRDFKALADQLGVTRCVIGGISMGAALSTRFTLDYPQMVAGLMIIRPAWLEKPMPENLAFMPTIASYMNGNDIETNLAALESTEAFKELVKSSESLATSVRMQFEKPKAAQRRVRLQRMPASSPIGDWSEVENLDVPTLVIGSDQDPVHPIEMAQAWANRIPNARFVEVVSKFVDPIRLEREVAEAVREFLAGLDLR